MTEEKKKKRKGRYGEFATTTTTTTTTPANVPTYGEFMAQKNAANAAANIAAGETTYAENTGEQNPLWTAPTEGWQSGVSYADVQEDTPDPVKNNTPEEGGATYAEGGKTVMQLIEEQRQASYADAEAARERATVDAMTSYQKNLATYGRKGESLAQAGMTGSGYGEYLQAQAYAQQRSDVQTAKAQETAAKAQADRVYYGDMAAEKQQQEETAKAETAQKNAAYAQLLGYAKSGEYTAEEIRNLAQRQGLTDEGDLAALEKAVGASTAEKEKESISENVTADMSDEKIAELYPNSQEEAKDARTEAAAAEIDVILSSGDTAAAESLVEKYHNNGAISADERQNFYMQKYTSEIETAAQNGDISAKNVKTHEQALEKAKNEGKISETDFEAAKKYLYESAATVIDGANVKFTSGTSRSDNTVFDLVINGETVESASFAKKPADKDTSNVLDTVSGGEPAEGTLVLYDDAVYVYVDSSGYSGWYKASRNWFNEGIRGSLANKRIYEIIKDDIAPTRARAEKPEHKAG